MRFFIFIFIIIIVIIIIIFISILIEGRMFNSGIYRTKVWLPTSPTYYVIGRIQCSFGGVEV